MTKTQFETRVRHILDANIAEMRAKLAAAQTYRRNPSLVKLVRVREHVIEEYTVTIPRREVAAYWRIVKPRSVP